MIIDRHRPNKQESPLRKPGSPKIKWSSDLEFDDTHRDSHHSSRFGCRSYALRAWSLLAASIDLLVIFSMSIFSFVAFALVNRPQAQFVLQLFSKNSHEALFHFLAVFSVGLFLLYLVMMRVFLGFTIGEWACDLRLGSLQQRLNRFYSLKVLARTAVLILTGVFTLPILSLITGRDICGGLVNLQLVPKK
jgi:hypothetical protein